MDNIHLLFQVIFIIILENGDVYGFGYNGFGQLGNGNYKDVWTPTLLTNIKNPKVISAGFYFSIIINGKFY